MFIIAVLFLWASIGIDLDRDEAEDIKLILIHLDAVSTRYFFEELNSGNLPNVQKFFSTEQIIPHAITYFPSKTPTVISNIKEGIFPDAAQLGGWQRIDSKSGDRDGLASTFIHMLSFKSRLGISNLIYGIPLLQWMAGPALVNAATLQKEYGVLEFYWYRMDSKAHFLGDDAYHSDLRVFDRNLGRLLRRLNDDIHVIVYSDHGMSFGKAVPIEDDIKDYLGDRAETYSYPNLYLKKPETKRDVALLLIRDTEVDYSFIETDDYLVTGFHETGELTFRIDPEDGRIAYEYEAVDPLGYSEMGYNGGYLTHSEWMKLTYKSEYPYAPVHIVMFLRNREAGDIITLLDKNRYAQTAYSRKGNHGGFTADEMSTPLLMKGEIFENLYGRDYFWLPELFRVVGNIDFNSVPARNNHMFSSSYDFKNRISGLSISLSPTYRVKMGTDYFFSNNNHYKMAEVWGKADLFRSYLTQIWLGTGIIYYDSALAPMLFIQHNLNVSSFFLKQSYASRRGYRIKAGFQIVDYFAIETIDFNSLGFKIDF